MKGSITMFYLETNENGEWKPVGFPEYKSSENAKGALKVAYEIGRIELPAPGSIRIVDSNGQVYFIYEGMNKGFRFMWRKM